jgi:acetylornithine deacetylase/succinyl-diaminopimelate desuccinylase-like protein
MLAANVGVRANNVIPSRAVADLDLRLVVAEHWQEQQERVIDYIRSQGYFVVDGEPSRDVLLAHPRVAMVKGGEFSYDAVRTPMDLPIAKEVIAAVESVRGKVVKWPTMGGVFPSGRWNGPQILARSPFRLPTTITASIHQTRTSDYTISETESKL